MGWEMGVWCPGYVKNQLAWSDSTLQIYIALHEAAFFPPATRRHVRTIVARAAPSPRSSITTHMASLLDNSALVRLLDGAWSVLDIHLRPLRWYLLSVAVLVYLRMRPDYIYVLAEGVGASFLIDWWGWLTGNATINLRDVPALERDDDDCSGDGSGGSGGGSGSESDSEDSEASLAVASAASAKAAKAAQAARAARAAAAKRRRTEQPRPAGYLVYDPVFGAVPKEVLDRWNEADSRRGEEEEGGSGDDGGVE